MTALTGREIEALRLLADGQTQAGMAQRLGTTERTVRRVTRALYAKLGARTAAHAVALATQHRIFIEPEVPAGYRLALIRN